MRIHKQDYDLTAADLAQYPVWEYALDEETNEGQDSRTVRPYTMLVPLDPRQSRFIVRATFHLADGTKMTGYIKPIILDEIGLMKPLVPIDMHPIIVTERERVTFWYAASKPDRDEIEQNYVRLNKGPSEVFPIKFAADIEVVDSITEGSLEGFLYCDEGVKDFFHLQPTDIRVVK
jgi:hypothetical protein